MNKEIFNLNEHITFDDVLIIPGYSEILPAEVNIQSDLTSKIKLNIPVISAAMDTVTEAPMAIAIARQGGLGIIHRNMSPEEQANQVDKVKRSESGMIIDPITLTPDATVQDAIEITAHYHISGLPIVDPDNGKLIGILTNRDIRFAEEQDHNKSVKEYMISDGLITAPVGTTLDQAKQILQKNRIEKLPLVDNDFHLKGLITVKDIQKKIQFPNATKDERGRLVVGAAVGVGNDVDQRIDLMVKQGLDVVAIDTAHGHTLGVVNTIKKIKSNWPDLPIIAGNVVTEEGTDLLIKAGADAIKVGVGAGSICTTRIIAGAGMPQLSAIYNCANIAKKSGIPIIADGGMKYSGDIIKALVAGAHVVMLGSMLAGLDESPGEIVQYEGRRYKVYRGMGSMAAMQGYGRDRYGTGQSGSSKLVPEGVEGIVAFKGSLADFIYQLVGGIRSGMGYAGAADLNQLRNNTRFSKITNAGLIESHPHNITITREAPNYQQRKF